MLGFYTNKPFAIFSKLIQFFGGNLKMDHVALVAEVKNNEAIVVIDSILKIDNRKWYTYFAKIGGIRTKLLTLDNGKTSLFEYCKQNKKDLLYIPINRKLSSHETRLATIDLNEVQKFNYRYSIWLAIASEIIPKSLLQRFFKKLPKTNKVFCSLFIAKHYLKIGLITQKEFDKNPLPSPEQLLSLPCFVKDSNCTIVKKIVI